MFFQRIYYICFRFLFLVLFLLLFLVCGYCFGSCFCPWYGALSLFLFVVFVLMLVSILLPMLHGMPEPPFFLYFSIWYAFFLLFMLFRIARGILFSRLSLSGMPFSCFSRSFGRLGAYFFLTFLYLVCLFLAFHALLDAPGHTFPFSFILWYVYLAVFKTYAKMIDARHLTGLSLDRIVSNPIVFY